VVEVMGRRCGYLALMGALASGADWVLIPENPPNLDNWEEKMCQVLRKGREIGRRDSIVIVAEGSQDRHGNPITSNYIKNVLEERLGEDTRVTILGHVQRGGSPSAFDRNLSTLVGAAAVDAIQAMGDGDEIPIIGMRGNKITRTPLSICLNETELVAQAIKEKDYERALQLRGNNFAEAFRTVRTLVRAQPHEPEPGQRQLRLAIINAGAPSPGMNTACRAAVRLGIDKGHTIFGVQNAFQGLIDGEIRELSWMSVNGWAHRGGAELGTNRKIPVDSDFYAIARNLEKHQIQGILLIGGWSGYEAVVELYSRRHIFPAFNIPIVCLPASIDNDLPASELSVGADTALNSIVSAVDKIKQSAVASRRVFVVEVLGQYCGYLALMSALASGAERVY
jgi:6-phosphofructokinase 1